MSKINGIETEWTLLQRKLGNLPEVEEEKEEEPELPDVDTIKHQVYDQLSLGDLEKLEDLEDESILLTYKQKRLKELKEQVRRNKFGYVKNISKVDWIDEVTKCEPEVYVIIHLWAPGNPSCDLLDDIFRTLAQRHPYAKFLRIKGSDAIRNFPDRNCPTVLVYKAGEMIKQWTGFGEGDVDSVEWALSQIGAVKTELTAPPTKKKKQETSFKMNYVRKRRDIDEDFDFDD